MTRKWKAIRQLLAMGFGLGPGFLLPLVLALRLDHADSDHIIVLLTMNVVGTAIITTAVEAYAVAELAWLIGKANPPRQALTAIQRGLLIKTAVGIAGVAVVTFLSFALTGTFAWSDIGWFLVIVASVAIACAAAPWSAVLILKEKSYYPLGLQGLRHILLIIAALIFPDLGIVLTFAFTLGEAIRALLLRFAARSELQNLEANLATESTADDAAASTGTRGGLYSQFGSNGITQASVLVERAAIATGPTGAVTYYELADKIAYVFIQACYSLAILPRMSRWATEVGSRGNFAAYSMYRSDMRKTMAVLSAVLVPLAVTAGVLSTVESLPTSARDIALYSAILLIAAIPITSVMASMRLLVMLNGQRYFLPVSVLSIAIMLTAGLGLFSWIGVAGVLVARLISRTLTMVLFNRAISSLAQKQNGSGRGK